MSGGEARRIAAARLLLAEHAELIIDEPTEHLDRRIADALIDDLVTASEGRAVLVISHDPLLLAHCQRVVSLGPPSGADPALNQAFSAPSA